MADSRVNLAICLPLQWLCLELVSDVNATTHASSPLAHEFVYGANLFDVIRLGHSLGASRAHICFAVERELDRMQTHASSALEDSAIAQNPYLAILFGKRQVHVDQLREYSRDRRSRNVIGILHGRERRASRSKSQLLSLIHI